MGGFSGSKGVRHEVHLRTVSMIYEGGDYGTSMAGGEEGLLR